MNENENPWKTVSSEQKYANPWISVREDKIINPAGKEGIYGVVSFNNIAIGIVPIDENGNIILVGQYRYPLNEYSWEIPEGGCLIGKENPLEAAKRELKEETGFTAKKWTKIGKIHTSNSVTNEEGFIFLAQDLTAGDTEPEETEVLRLKTIPLKEAVKMVQEMQITDSLSMVGILLAEKLINAV
jgi:8-oxo-dGTP pyrophosphatase MutT (NUDIX family)